MALDVLDDLAAVIAQHPDARQELETALGSELLAELLKARATIEHAVVRLDGTGGAAGVTRLQHK